MTDQSAGKFAEDKSVNEMTERASFVDTRAKPARLR